MAGGNNKKQPKFNLKVPKGTRDHHPSAMALRKRLFGSIAEVFEKHGGVTIDTPVFELKEILSGKYGEDSKLIYDLQDQGGELCSLRYDLTVPFARFLAMNPSQYQKIKRYHIAKVYRRDNPAMTKGRMREFYQCDFDIAGQYDAMIPDAEVLAIVNETLTKVGIKGFTIKVNHRKLLDGMFAVCGTPQDKIRSISSAVDKLDKSPWEDVRKEMTEEKGLDPEIADKIGEYVKLKGKQELLDKLTQDEALNSNADAQKGIKEMRLLFEYLELFGVMDVISLDLSLARGLDYYTGMIFETITEASAPPGFSKDQGTQETEQKEQEQKPKEKSSSKKKKAAANGEEEVDETQIGVGSIAGGGRYDELVGMFSQGTQIPCVGLSLGIERLYSILYQQQLAASQEESTGKETQVFVMSVGGGLLPERMAITKQLWDADIKTEYLYKAKPKAAQQFEAIERDQIPYAVIVAPDEFAAGNVRIKEQVGKEAAEKVEGDNKNGVVVPRDKMVEYLKEKLNA